ncbi:hypothetical protein TcWFU_003560 [Taenia crassiceps]|uniref:Uncharacterized protein n=1 Tax=Taenia crassiceps TaxID=6207 RepID=A0ABR4Q8P6_9CEST
MVVAIPGDKYYCSRTNEASRIPKALLVGHLSATFVCSAPLSNHRLGGGGRKIFIFPLRNPYCSLRLLQAAKVESLWLLKGMATSTSMDRKNRSSHPSSGSPDP